ncbi:MAG: TonB-dependent receptor [Rhodothermaceae bacterium]|nr:TonB-dependent receptor [Rhodothermaceae bacterium]
MPRLLLVALLLSLIPFAAQAQSGIVRGTVFSADTGIPLQGATIQLGGEGMPLFAATNADGAFALRRVASGTYRLRVTFVGYRPHEEDVTVARGATVIVRIAMTEDAAQVGDVVVEAERASGATSLSAGLQRLTPADLNRVPVPGVSGDLAGYLQTVPGITAVGDRGGQLFVRGGTAAQNLTRLDGLRLYRPFHILGFYSAFPSEIVDEADVYTGGFPARFGGRLSSVLDVRARAGSKSRFSASASVAPALSTAHVEGPLIPGRASVLLSVRESLIEQAFPSLFGQRFPYRFGDRFGKLDALLGEDFRFSVTGVQTHDRGNVAGTAETYLGDTSPLDLGLEDSSEVRWEEGAIGGRLAWQPRSLPLRIEASGSRSYAESVFGVAEALATGSTPARSAQTDGWDAALDGAWFVRGGEIRAGAAFYQADVGYRLADRFTGLAADTVAHEELAGYVEAEVPLAAEFTLEGGLRVTRFSPADQTVLGPRGRLIWKPSRAGFTREVGVAVGLVHQGLVGLQDQRDVGDVFTAYIPVQAGQPIPSAFHAVASWRGEAGPALRLAAEVFYKQFPDLLVARLDPFPGFTTTLDEANGAAYGLDLRVEHTTALSEATNFYIFAGYGLSQVEYEATTGAFPPPHDQRHALHLLGRIRSGDFSVSAAFQYGSGFPYTPSAGFDEWVDQSGGVTDVGSEPGQTRVLYGERGSRRLPAYHRLDLWLERTVERPRVSFTLRAGAVNVYNRNNLFYLDLFTLKRINQLPVFPSVGVKVEVR